jgi:hypothetical protein
MEYEGGLARRIPAALPVHAVAVADIEHALLVRLDGGMELGHARRTLLDRRLDTDITALLVAEVLDKARARA